MLTLVYGYGVSGKSAVHCLKEMGHSVAVYADVPVEVEDGVLNLCGMDVDKVLQGVSLVVVSPSIDLQSPLVAAAKSHGIEVIGEIELGARNCSGDMIAVTGTNGKTTCVQLITHILKNTGINADYYGNIGVPFAAESAQIAEDKVAVLEVSSFQLATCSLFCPKIAVCLNIADDHLEYHGTMQNYIKCKKNIFSKQDYRDYAVLNYDDDVVRGFADEINSNIYFFSLSGKVRGAYRKGKSIYFCDKREEYIMDVDEINMIGEHNIANCLAAIAVCKILNIPTIAITNGLKQFKTAPHRLQPVCKICNVNFFNDSKSTNILSTLAACNAMSGKTTLLVGGYDKGLDYCKLFDDLPLKVSTVICYGENRDKMCAAAAKNYCLTVIKADSIEDAIEISTKVECENVLFSPATSSFDKFKNYAERGEFFNNYLLRLKH